VGERRVVEALPTRAADADEMVELRARLDRPDLAAELRSVWRTVFKPVAGELPRHRP
jgi:hypothetical protein